MYSQDARSRIGLFPRPPWKFLSDQHVSIRWRCRRRRSARATLQCQAKWSQLETMTTKRPLNRVEMTCECSLDKNTRSQDTTTLIFSFFWNMSRIHRQRWKRANCASRLRTWVVICSFIDPRPKALFLIDTMCRHGKIRALARVHELHLRLGV